VESWLNSPDGRDYMIRNKLFHLIEELKEKQLLKKGEDPNSPFSATTNAFEGSPKFKISPFTGTAAMGVIDEFNTTTATPRIKKLENKQLSLSFSSNAENYTAMYS
jgi:hypothetical protein